MQTKEQLIQFALNPPFFRYIIRCFKRMGLNEGRVDGKIFQSLEEVELFVEHIETEWNSQKRRLFNYENLVVKYLRECLEKHLPHPSISP